MKFGFAENALKLFDGFNFGAYKLIITYTLCETQIITLR